MLVPVAEKWRASSRCVSRVGRLFTTRYARGHREMRGEKQTRETSRKDTKAQGEEERREEISSQHLMLDT